MLGAYLLLEHDDEALNYLVDLLNRHDAVLERALYFALAGRGIGEAISHLRWAKALLVFHRNHERVLATQSFAHPATSSHLQDVEKRPCLCVDRTKMHFGASLLYHGLAEGAASALDADLAALAADEGQPALLRTLACLCVGVRPDTAADAVSELLLAVEQYHQTGRFTGSRLGAILAHTGDDLQRALYFATAGRAAGSVEAALGELADILDQRCQAFRIWQRERAQGERTQRPTRMTLPVSPYVNGNLPEACVFHAYDLATRDLATHALATR